MFNHLFNTYKAVTPPPKSRQDFKEEIYLEPEDGIGIIDPLWLSPISRVPLVDKPSNRPYVLETSIDFADETPLESTLYRPNSLLVDSIINTGGSFVGSKYTYGGTSPDTGFDCSGFLQYIFRLNGVDIPRDTEGIFKVGKEVSLSSIQPGDIICSKGRGSSGRHVQMVSRVDPESNLIYVLEAKGRKYGIVEGPLTKKKSDIISIRRVLNLSSQDPFLANQDVQRPRTQRFNDNRKFAQTLNKAYRKALSEKGLNPDYSYMLTALDAIESGWGTSVKGNYNYGNITAGKGEPWHKQTGKRKWRDFKSIEDYVSKKIDFLFRQRYRFFETFTPNSNIQYAMLTLANRGYDPGNSNYGKSVAKVYNDVIKKLS